MTLSDQRLRNRHKVINTVLHLSERLGQTMDLDDITLDGNRLIKTKRFDLTYLLKQKIQWFRGSMRQPECTNQSQ